jgi:hypothetical protein
MGVVTACLDVDLSEVIVARPIWSLLIRDASLLKSRANVTVTAATVPIRRHIQSIVSI